MTGHLITHTLIVLACGVIVGHVWTILRDANGNYRGAYHKGWEAHKATIQAIERQREITRHGRRLRRDYP